MDLEIAKLKSHKSAKFGPKHAALLNLVQNTQIY